jgi:hypothetical protein
MTCSGRCFLVLLDDQAALQDVLLEQILALDQVAGHTVELLLGVERVDVELLREDSQLTDQVRCRVPEPLKALLELGIARLVVALEVLDCGIHLVDVGLDAAVVDVLALLEDRGDEAVEGREHLVAPLATKSTVLQQVGVELLGGRAGAPAVVLGQ